VKIYVAAAEVVALRKKERRRYTTKIGGKTSLGMQLLFLLVKFSFPVTRLMP
jgi:hypothetical protein